MKNRYTTEQVEDSIRDAGGIIARAADQLGCCRWTVYRYLNEFDLWPVVEEARESLIDEAEETLHELLHHSEDRIRADIAKFIASRLGRSRGWGEKLDVGFERKAPEVVNIIFDGPKPPELTPEDKAYREKTLAESQAH